MVVNYARQNNAYSSGGHDSVTTHPTESFAFSLICQHGGTVFYCITKAVLCRASIAVSKVRHNLHVFNLAFSWATGASEAPRVMLQWRAFKTFTLAMLRALGDIVLIRGLPGQTAVLQCHIMLVNPSYLMVRRSFEWVRKNITVVISYFDLNSCLHFANSPKKQGD